MANIKSAEKRIRVSERKRKANKSRVSTLRTHIKKFNLAIENNDIEQAKELHKVIDRDLKKAAHKNLIHENKASRELSKITKRLNAAIAAA